MRTLVLAIVLLGSIALLRTGAAEDETLRIGVQNERPPFSFSDADGELRGFDVDIARALCAALEIHCDLVPLDFTSLIPGLRNGRIDAAVASISITEARRQLVDFTQKYYQATNRFVGRTDTLSDASPDALAGKIIGVKRGTTHDRYLSDVYADAASIRRYSHSDEIYIDLALGRLDLAFGDVISHTESFLKTDLGEQFGFVGPPLSDPQWFGHGEGIAVRKGDDTLLTRLNRALREILADGTYANIRSRYFDYDIYGADASTAQASGAAE